MAVRDDDTTLLLFRDSRTRQRQRVSSESEIGIQKGTETADAYKSRWRSIRLIYIIVFLNALSFTITLPSLWTYLKVLDPEASASLLGWIVSAFSLGQIFSGPLFGGWSNYRRSSKEPMIVCLALSCLSYVLYMYLESLPDHRIYFMIASRGIIGFSFGQVAVLRSYVAGATTLSERTTTMANINICGSVGFIVGPVLQAVLVLLCYPGPVESQVFHFNMYTSPALFAAISAFLAIVILVFVFKEHRVTEELEDMPPNIQALKGTESSGKPDYVAVVACILLFFTVAFSIQTFQTIMTPLTMHMFAWNKSKATFIQGLATGGASVVAIFVYIGVKMVSKRVNERTLLLFGFMITFAAFFVFLPWGDQLPPRGIAPIQNTATLVTTQNPTMTNESKMNYVNTYFNKTVEDVLINDTHKDPLGYTLNISVLYFSPHGCNKTSDPSPLLMRKGLSKTLHSLYMAIEKYIVEIFNHCKLAIMNSGQSSTSLAEPKGTKKLDLTRAMPLSSTKQYADALGSSKFIRNISVLLTHDSARNGMGTALDHIRTILNKDLQSEELAETSEVLSELDHNKTSLNGAYHMSTLAPSYNTTYEPEGCPWRYPWCGYVPAVYLEQYICGTVLFGIGYPLCHVMTYTIYSKVLGPKPQALWMGVSAACGSVAGMIGPLFVTYIYDMYGPRATFAGCSSVLATTVLFVLFMFRRLVPYSNKQILVL